MDTHDADHGAQSTVDMPARGRQLTLGECIAIAELASRFDPERLPTISPASLLKFVDAMRVCTTCGKRALEHDVESEWSRACTRWTPRD